MPLPRAVSWMVFEDERLLRATIDVARALRIPEIRTSFSWADWERPGGEAWFDHFVGAFRAAGIKLVPCLFYTPLGRARVPQHAGASPEERAPKTSYPPRRLADYAEFTAAVLARYGDAFEWIQFWNESNWDVYWSWKMDPDWGIFGDMVRPAIALAKRAGKKILLGGLSPYDVDWVEAMFRYGVMQEADALGIHAFPGTWDAPEVGGEDSARRKGRPWRGLDAEAEDARQQLRAHGSRAEVWYTEIGYSTFGEGAFLKEREQGQIVFWEELLRCAADRVYWHAVMDQAPDTPTDNELNAALAHDDRAYHFGIVRADGTPKPLYFHWQQHGRARQERAALLPHINFRGRAN